MSITPLLDRETAEKNLAETKPPYRPQEAKVEATRCLFCFDAPCIHACPTGIDIPAFIKKVAHDRPIGAARTILDANVLGGSCARVCPTEELCEGACVMLDRDEKPIAIGRLQRFATDAALEQGVEILKAAEHSTGKRVALMGAGPASLACAAELRRLGHEAVIFEKQEQAGGLNTYGIAYYKMPPRVSLEEVAQIERMGVVIRRGMEVGKHVDIATLRDDYDGLFIGIGLGATRALSIPGEDLPESIEAIEFIRDLHTKPLDEVAVGRRVAVIGGGNTAIDAATQAKRLGAEQVSMIYRRGPEEMSAYEHEYEHAKADGVEFLFHAQPVAILGADAVTGLRLVRTQLDATGRAEVIADSEVQIALDMVIRAVGQEKQKSRLARLLPDLEFGERGEILRDFATGKTNLDRVYAGGDCANGGSEVVDAVAEGRRAAFALHAELTGEHVAPHKQATRFGAPSGSSAAGFTHPLRVRALEQSYHQNQAPSEETRNG